MRKLFSPEITKVLDVLIGETTATGESDYDERVYNNLLTLLNVTDWCIEKIMESSETAESEEYPMRDIGMCAKTGLRQILDTLKKRLEPEKTEYIPETKAISSARSYVDLDEKVFVTLYDDEHDDWTQRIETIADVLDSVCDGYTVLPSTEPHGKWLEHEDYRGIAYLCSECGYFTTNRSDYCPNCGAKIDRGLFNG